jgi:hypothetical protein
MKTMTLRSLALLSLFAIPAISHAAAPVNDTFEKATVLTGRSVSLTGQTGVSATAHSLDPYVGAPSAVKPTRSLWYRFDAPFTATGVRFIINDNTPLGIRAGVFLLGDADGRAGSLISEAQATVTGGFDIDTITFNVSARRRYYLCVDAAGPFSVTLKVPGQPNDFFESATVLTGNEDTISASNLNASNDGDIPTISVFTNLQAGVWFTWTPSFSGAAVIDTNFSEYQPEVAHDTLLVVYTGTALSNLVVVGSDDDSGHANNSKVSFTAVSGTPYKIWVGTYAGNRRGNITLSYYPATSPGVFSLVAPPVVSETQGSAQFAVRRLRPGIAATVTASTNSIFGSPATPGVDYTALSSVLSFGAGVAIVTPTVTILSDNVAEGTEHFGLALSAPTAGASLGSPTLAPVEIRDPSGNSAPSFTSSSIRVREGAGQLTIPVHRTTGLGGAVRMIVSAGGNADTAQELLDYTIPAPQFDIAPYQGSFDIPVTIVNDGAYRGERAFTLTMSPVTPGIVSSGSTSIVIYIDDDDLVVAATGRVSGVLDIPPGIAGSFDFTVSATGVITGKVTMARGVFSFTGTLNASGYLAARIGPVTGPVRSLQIQLLSSADKTYRVTLNDGDLGTATTSDFTATNYTALTPCPVAGKFTFVDGTSQPIAAGLVTVSTLGSSTLSGKIFDGTAFVASGTVDALNNLSVGASLYAGQGRVLMSALLPTGLQSNIGFLGLLRPGRSNQGVELPPIDVSNTGFVSRYVPPPANTRALSSWSGGTGNAELIGGGFVGTVNKALTISTANKVTVTTLLPEKLSITVTPSTGLFTGSVIPTGSSTAKPIYGYLLQNNSPAIGYGFFLNGTIQGSVTLGAP